MRKESTRLPPNPDFEATRLAKQNAAKCALRKIEKYLSKDKGLAKYDFEQVTDLV